jgi:tetratricopeptide (TPR) repeat protein/ADP-heptose:LPS heptosyltransferase/glycosyltransferase involved in cell wall biosynthesis
LFEKSITKRLKPLLRTKNEQETANKGEESVDDNKVKQLLGKARSLHEAGRRYEAMPYYRQVIAWQPDNLEALNNLAIALKQEQQYPEAISLFRQALAIAPQTPYLHNNLANILCLQGEFPEAKYHYQQALAGNPDYAEAWYGLGNAIAALGELESAIHCYQQSLTRNPNYLDTYNNLGNVLQAKGQLQAAFDYYQKTLQRNPNHTGAKWNKGFTLLLAGDLKRGFIEYEWRWQMKGGNFRSPRNYPQPLWDGADISGKRILIHCEQGFGDTIQFIRYLSFVKQKVGEFGQVILECPKPLLRLFKAIASIDQLVPEGEPLPDFDVYAPLMSLPRIFGTTLATIPANIPYIDAVEPPSSLPLARGNVEGVAVPLKIGIVWAGKPFYKGDRCRYRACSIQHFLELFNFEIAANTHIQLYSLQKETTEAELSLLSANNIPNNIIDVGSHLNDFADTANAIADLDLVISVDTAVAHLAGAMGKPVWVLLPFAPDWRWMLNREDSPWYPKIMRLFRQPQPGDWDGIFQQVKLALIEFINRSPLAPLHKGGTESPLTPLSKGGTGSPLAPLPPKSPKVGGLPPKSPKVGGLPPKSPKVGGLPPKSMADFGGQVDSGSPQIWGARGAIEVGGDLNPDRLHKQGAIAYQAGNISEAIAYYHQVLEINPKYAKTHNNLAIALKQQGNLKEAIAHYRQAITWGDANELPLANIYHNLANALESIGEFAEAIGTYREAINLSPDLAEAYYNLARLLNEQGQTEEAIAHYKEAINYNPQFFQAYSNLGNIFKELNQLSEAIYYYEQAIELKPDYAEAHWNLGITLLLNGDLQRGFAEYEWRWQTADFPRRSFPQPLWDGTPLNGQTILLYSEQGLGDRIQFIRYVSLVAQQGGRIIVECSPPLARLFQTLPYVEEIVIKGEPLPEFDYHCPLMSLPYIFGTTLETVTANIPYLYNHIPPLSKGWLGGDPILLNPNFKIGIVWAGNPQHKKDALRSCDLKYFLPLLDLPGVTFYSLQKGDQVKDLAPDGGSPLQRGEFNPDGGFPEDRGESIISRIENLDKRLNDFADTAAVVAQLDLVITVDTSVVHLVGAMGKPVWLLLGNHQDWRWMLGREDSPWYPTMRIFRQSQPGDWSELFQRVFLALQETLTKREKSTDSDQLEIRQLQQIIAQQPNYAEAYHNLGYQFKQQGNLVKAIAHYQKAVELKPHYFKAHYHLGNAFLELNQIPEAIAHYEQAIKLECQQADAHTNLGFALLMSGDFTRGFAEYEWRLQRDGHKKLPFSQPAWNGSAMPGKTILLYTEEGFGDSIQFIRYVPLVAEKFAQVIVQVSHPLLRLFQTVIESDHLILDTDNLPEFDVHASFMSLPYLLGTTWETIPVTIPYLYAPITQSPLTPRTTKNYDPGLPRTTKNYSSGLPRTTKNYSSGLPRTTKNYSSGLPLPKGDGRGIKGDGRGINKGLPGSKIGIVWAGSDRYGNQRDRSCKLVEFCYLMDISGLSFYSLQVGLQSGELTQASLPVPVIDLGSHFQDFADTASAIAQLDLVITIDTSVAHLAGAMGKPVWVLLPFAPDCRWMLNRVDTPWYPTMRLFRQPQPGDWNSVFHQIKLALMSSSHSRKRISHPDKMVESNMLSSETRFLRTQISSNTREKPMNISDNARLRLGIGWQLSQTTGWGIYGMNLTLQLLKSTTSPGFYPILLMPSAVKEADLNPLHRALLHPIFSHYKKLQELAAQNPGKQIACDFPVIHALGKNLSGLDIPRGSKNIGVIFLEDTKLLSKEAQQNAEKYDIIITGSTWNEKLLKYYGISHVVTVQQGFDPTIFHPAPKSNLFGDRFVVFSGGKLEYRKGQDIVIAAFKEFHRRHPEALLITAWHNFWPQYMQGLDETVNVVGLPQVTENKQLKIADWLIANGLPADSFIDLGLIPNHQVGQILREADVAIFTSRCEGGTNLAAMESMACGIPTILSANTGHLDLISDRHCYPLSRQLPVQSTPHFFSGMVGWGESDVDEAINTLERVYVNRQEAKQKGLKAAQFMQNWTWEKQVQRFLSVVQDIL